MIQKPKIQLFDQYGDRLYINPDERRKYASVLGELDKFERMFCLMLHHTGCRLQEALNITLGQVDISERCVIIETLKRRRKGHFRQIPLPNDYINELDLVYDLKKLQSNRTKNKKALQQRVWTFSKSTAFRTCEGCNGISGDYRTKSLSKRNTSWFCYICYHGKENTYYNRSKMVRTRTA